MPLEPAWKPNILKLRCSKIIKDQASNSPPLASASLALSAAIQLSSLWHPWPKPAIWLPLRLYSVFLSGTSTALVMGSAGKCLQYEMASTTNCTTCSRPPVCHSSIQEMSPTEFVWKKIQFPKIDGSSPKKLQVCRHSQTLLNGPMVGPTTWSIDGGSNGSSPQLDLLHRICPALCCDLISPPPEPRRGRLMWLQGATDSTDGVAALNNHIYMLCTHTHIYI